MSLPALCEVCGTRHHGHQGHVFPKVSRVTQKAVERAVVKPDVKPVVKPQVKPPAADAGRFNGLTKQWRERDPEAYRRYMRLYMAAQRAIAAGRALRWPRAA